MATNQTRDSFLSCWHKSATVSHPTTPLSGQPCRIGLETGMALTDEGAGGNTSTQTTVDTGPFRALLSVKGVNDSGNSAVAIGDAIFYVDADVGDGTGFLSKKSSGYFYGFADDTVGSGSTATINVWHVPSPGSGTLGSGTVGATNLATDSVTTVKIADDQVTAAKLTDTLATGFISLPLAQARLIATNDIAAKNATDGGLVSLDTDPTLKRVNGATDKKLRLSWAATSVIPVTWDITYPPDLDDTANVIVHVLAAMAGATDTPTLAVAYFEGLGDTNAGGNTAAITGTTIADYSRTITAANIGAYPNGASIEFVPAAHGTDALHIYAAWVEYTRK